MKIYNANHHFLPELARAPWQDADGPCIRLVNSVHVQYVEASVIIDSFEEDI